MRGIPISSEVLGAMIIPALEDVSFAQQAVLGGAAEEG
jgi:hypothetical protein